VQRIERALQLLLHQGLRRESAQIAGNPNLEAGSPPRIRGSLPLALMSPAAQSGAVPSPRDGSVSTQQQVPMASKTDASIQTEVCVPSPLSLAGGGGGMEEAPGGGLCLRSYRAAAATPTCFV
jgi:hypothetical protein